MEARELLVGGGILMTGGTTAALIYFGSILLFPDTNIDLGETVSQIQNGDIESLLNENLGAVAGEEAEVTPLSEQPAPASIPDDGISLSEAGDLALDYVGEGSVSNVSESDDFGVAWEVTVELGDGSEEIVLVSSAGDTQLK